MCNTSNIAGSDTYEVQVLVRGRDKLIRILFHGQGHLVSWPCVRQGVKVLFTILCNDAVIHNTKRNALFLSQSEDLF